MSVLSQPGTAAAAAKPRQSQWALIACEFRKRRMAVVAAYVLLGLVCLSVFAPFLANDRPIVYRGCNRFEFREAGRTVRGILGSLAQDGVRTPQPGLESSIALQFRLMSAEVSPTGRAELAAIQDRIRTALARPDKSAATRELKEIQRVIRQQFEAIEPQLVPRTHWPVVRSLSAIDAAFLVAIPLFLTRALWSRLVRSPDLRGRRTAQFLVLIPLLACASWWLFVPGRLDRTVYKDGVLAANDTEQKAPVVYQSVMWPPIAFALDEYDLAGKSAPPAWYPESWRPKSSSPVSHAARKAGSPWDTRHWMGSDASGRDVLCRMLWGGRVSLTVGMVAVAIYVTIGVIVGAIAGYFRGVCDLILSRIIEVVICFPSFFLILTIVAMVGPGLLNIMVVIGLTGWTGIARLVRGEFLRLVDQEFVLAGRALGYSPLRLIFRHVLPNAMAPVLVSATFGIAGAILTESALSFLGLGISKPTPSWGSLLADGREALDHAPWLIHFPGLAIFITITSYNLIGEALRDAADPRLRGSR